MARTRKKPNRETSQEREAKIMRDFVNDEESEQDIVEEDGPPVIDPYGILGLEKEATADDVRKAYRKCALKNHPDKAAEDEKEAAKKKFQEIAFAYAVLSDDRRRKRYDLTGSTAESLEDDEDFDWLKFYREQFENVVNEDAINKFSNGYKGSAEERGDLIRAYNKAKGNLHAIYQLVMLSDILVDDERFRKIFDEEIENGTIESYPAYAKETDDTRKKAQEAARKGREEYEKRQRNKEAATKTNDNGKPKSETKDTSGMADLAALIQQRQKSRAGIFFDNLEAKYAPKSRGNKRSTPMEEPPEEAFQAMAARKKQKQSSKSKKKAKEENDNEEMDLGEEYIGDSDEEKLKLRKAKSKGKGVAQAGRKA